MDLFLKDALLLYFYHWDLSGSGAVMTDRLTAGREDYMSIAGLGTYSSSGYYYKAVTKSRSGSLSNVSDDYLSKEIPKDDPMHDFKEAVRKAVTSSPYCKCIIANIKTEALYAFYEILVYGYHTDRAIRRTGCNGEIK